MTVGMGEAFVGRIVHYYPRINVGILELTDGEINLGDVIHIQGKRTNFVQTVGSIQIDHHTINHADKGRCIGIQVKEKVRSRDQVGVARWILPGLS
jgi:translation elongation factor EF-1alpha